MQPVVALNGVGVSRGGFALLRDIDLVVGPAEVIGVSGPNGSGKTTLLRLVATLIRPDRGSGVILGAPVASPAVGAVRGRIGLISHEPALIPELTLFENLVHVCRLSGLDPGRVLPALDAVGLGAAADRPARAASRGMQRRLETAHMLIRKPDLLLLDEAVAGLDVDASGLVRALVELTVGGGGAVIIVSHDPAHLSGCDRVAAISAGRLVPA